MTRPFMIRFSFGGKGCYANVYTYNNCVAEFHVHIIEHKFHDGMPSKIILVANENTLHLHEPKDCPRAVIEAIVEQIEKRSR